PRAAPPRPPRRQPASAATQNRLGSLSRSAALACRRRRGFAVAEGVRAMPVRQPLAARAALRNHEGLGEVPQREGASDLPRPTSNGVRERRGSGVGGGFGPPTIKERPPDHPNPPPSG